MKNLKRLLGLMAISGFAFGFAGNVNAEEETVKEAKSCSAGTLYVVNYDETTYGCYKSLSDVIESSSFKEGETITLQKNIDESSGMKLSKNIVFDLGGHTITLKKDKNIAIADGAKVTFKNGTIKIATQDTNAAMFSVTGTEKGTTLTFDKSITINASGMKDGTNAVISVEKAEAQTVVDIAGTWTGLKGELIDCGTGEDEKLTINLSADVKSAKTILGVDAGVTAVNVTGGTYTSDTGNAFELSKGTVKISGGTVTAKAGNAIAIKGADASERAENLNVEITNGTFISKNTNAISFTQASKGTYKITNGIFTSEGKDSDDNVLPAIAITDWEFLKNHEGMITGGTFTNGIVGKVNIAADEYKVASAAAAILTKGSKITQGNGSQTVGGTTTTEPTDQKPGSTTGDDTPGKNPQTYDGIMSYVTLAISSLGALGIATKKVLF